MSNLLNAGIWFVLIILVLALWASKGDPMHPKDED
jgi:hypothetical protein